MSNLQIIEELCAINSSQASLTKKMATVLEQHGVVCFEEERAALERRFTRLIGHDEAPDTETEGNQQC